MTGAFASTGTSPTVIDLFCGAGGFSAGLVRSGFNVVGAIDSWDVAIRTYRRNFNHKVVQADLSAWTSGDLWRGLGLAPFQLDLVVGGPPCQGFSVQRIGPDRDERNNLVLEFARHVAELAPRMFIMENVPGLLGKRGRELVSRFESAVLAAGYEFISVVVDASSYGVPQVRRRVFYCGWRPGETRPFSFPRPTHDVSARVTVMQSIGDLPPAWDGIPPPGADPLHRRMRLSPMNLRRLQAIPPGGGMQDLPIELRVDCHKEGADRIGHRYVYGRLDPSTPASTITARFDSFTRGRFAHPYEHRNITLREGARLQTFDDRFTFEGTQEQVAAMIGNAVPPRMAEVVGRAVAVHLANRDAKEVDSLRPAVAIRSRGVPQPRLLE